MRAHSSATESGNRISPDGLSRGDRPNGRASADEGARGDDPPLINEAELKNHRQLIITSMLVIEVMQILLFMQYSSIQGILQKDGVKGVIYYKRRFFIV